MKRWSVGDEVFGSFGKSFAGEGTFAEYIVAAEEGLIARKPSSLEFAQAAALPTPGLAAFQSVQAVTPKRGDTILIIGAAGGVGSYAVQLATRDGAKVIGTGLPGQEEYLRSLGATQVIDFTNQDVVGTVKSTHPEGVEGLIDLVSRDAESLGRDAQVLRTGGKVATTMNAADPESLGRLGVEGTNVLAYASSPQDLEWLAQLVSNGELKVPISQVFALEETGQALAKLQTGEVQGKIVLDCSPGS